MLTPWPRKDRGPFVQKAENVKILAHRGVGYTHASCKTHNFPCWFKLPRPSYPVNLRGHLGELRFVSSAGVTGPAYLMRL